MPIMSGLLRMSGLSASLRPRVPFRRLAVLPCLLLLLGSAAAARAQVTIHVPTDQPTIQAGINAANNGDTVLVAPGTYNETIDFKGKAITVQSSAGPNTTVINWAYPPTHADPFYAFVVTFQTNETRSSVLSGFTIQGGGLPFKDFQTTVFEGFFVVSVGQVAGGIEVLNGAAPSIVGNIITDNGCAGIFSSGSAPLIQNNEISYTTYPTFTDVVGTPGYSACFREPLRRCLISKRRIGRERFSTFGPRIVRKKRLQACLLCLGSPFSGLQRHYAP
jgi:parallel beta-helix repeat protein